MAKVAASFDAEYLVVQQLKKEVQSLSHQLALQKQENAVIRKLLPVELRDQHFIVPGIPPPVMIFPEVQK
jgi:hypothetical protein